MKILLAVDDSPFSDRAVDEVAERPWQAGSEVKVLSVAEPPNMPVVEGLIPPGNYIEELEKAVEEQARAAVSKAAERLRAKQGNKLRVTTDVVMGHPKYSIPDEAAAWGADLIVVGSHGYRGLTRLSLGSVSQAVASHAKCSVEIVRG